MEKEFNKNNQMGDKVKRMNSEEIEMELNGIAEATGEIGLTEFEGTPNGDFLDRLGMVTEDLAKKTEKFFLSPYAIINLRNNLRGVEIDGIVMDSKKIKRTRMCFVALDEGGEHLMFFNNGTIAQVKPVETDNFRIIEQEYGGLMDQPIKEERIDGEGKLKEDFTRALLDNFESIFKAKVVLRSDNPDQKEKLFAVVEKVLRMDDPLMRQTEKEIADEKERDDKKTISRFKKELKDDTALNEILDNTSLEEVWERDEQVKAFNDEMEIGLAKIQYKVYDAAEERALMSPEERKRVKEEDEMVEELMWEVNRGRRLRRWEETRERELKYSAFEAERPVMEDDSECLSKDDDNLIKLFQRKLDQNAAEDFLSKNSKTELDKLANEEDEKIIWSGNI